MDESMAYKYSAKFMKYLLFVLMIVSSTLAADSLEVQFREALLKDQDQDIEGAIQGYQAIIAEGGEVPKIASRAMYYLGECYRKQGKNKEAIEQFQRLIGQYPDQTDVVSLAQRQISTLEA